MNLFFLSDELLNPCLRTELRIPLRFVCFAYIEGSMYKHFRNEGTFAIQAGKRRYNGNIVYGAIFQLDDASFYTRLLDARYACSLSALRRNHVKDMHHRIVIQATPIHFDSLSDLGRLKYRETDSIGVQCYFGNQNNPKIARRLSAPNSYRIIDGINKIHFSALHKEEA